MADFSQTTISNAFSSMKLLYYDSNFTEISLQGSDWQWSSSGLDKSLAPVQGFIRTNDGLVWLRIYASFDLNELNTKLRPWCCNVMCLFSSNNTPSVYWYSHSCRWQIRITNMGWSTISICPLHLYVPDFAGLCVCLVHWLHKLMGILLSGSSNQC